MVPYSRASRTKPIKREALVALLDPTVFALTHLPLSRLCVLFCWSPSLSLSLALSVSLRSSLSVFFRSRNSRFGGVLITGELCLLWDYKSLWRNEGRKEGSLRGEIFCSASGSIFLGFVSRDLCFVVFCLRLLCGGGLESGSQKKIPRKCLLVGRRVRVCVCFHAIRSVVTNEAKKLSFVEILEDLYRLCLLVRVQCFIAFTRSLLRYSFLWSLHFQISCMSTIFVG